MAARKKAVAKRGSTALVTDDRPDFMGEGSGRGQEGVGVDDLTIPRLSIIQDLSPQRKKNDPAYIDGADSGMMFNSVTNELYGDAVKFVPCFYRKEWVVWKHQDEGGGFNGAFATQAEASDFMKANDMIGPLTKKGEPLYEANDTGQQFGIILHEDGRMEEVCISLSKSKRKIDRQFNTQIKLAGGDRFEKVYEVSAVEDQNAAGQDYYNFHTHPLGYVNQETYVAAEKLYDAISAGERDVNRNPDSGQTTSDEF